MNSECLTFKVRTPSDILKAVSSSCGMGQCLVYLSSPLIFQEICSFPFHAHTISPFLFDDSSSCQF